jgi:hypothetical protein
MKNLLSQDNQFLIHEFKRLWEPPTLNQALDIQHGPQQLQRPLVHTL